MGNQICCQQPVSEQNKQQLYELSSNKIDQQADSSNKIAMNGTSYNGIPQPELPELSSDVQTILHQYRPYEQEFTQQDNLKTVAFGTDIYHGPLDQTHRPTSLGKMYKSNGALFIGHFVEGKAQGPCFYIMKDGAFYKGEMKDNKADCQSEGFFVSKSFQYTGGFKNNQFHGKGIEKALDKLYLFNGLYENGKKVEGTMRWGNGTKFQYVYMGGFNQEGQFEGKGKYTDPEGIYEGDFLKSEKHGFGIYSYNTKLRYEGQYRHNQKQGQGKIVNFDGSIAYKGVFKNGMPNGKGIATSRTGQEFQAEWVDGIDKRHL